MLTDIYRCKYCPNPEGALKQINGTSWVHVACAALIPRLRFEDGKLREKIVENATTTDRLGVQCDICGWKDGLTISV